MQGTYAGECDDGLVLLTVDLVRVMSVLVMVVMELGRSEDDDSACISINHKRRSQRRKGRGETLYRCCCG